ncbi:hypothetical protein HYH02_012024 [Chlamydomonas schloesseri]|uniref:Uncharacterized protein n=1 Tax=Chlamydomonas schloesseri TaxID=2026947 RepID=A0A835VZH6_9CHLO|nr:hypothetical protein HYH02_012024 [Chlamydomonas schloesseri]|eukprot:KAG2435027.1 hypothetical protein HYH02_012024 [Chlamydomonas schloesseri]
MKACLAASLITGRAAAGYGGGNETEAQLEGRAAAGYGGGNETEAQLEGRAAAGRARLKQVNPRRWSGRVVHKECGQVLVIDKAPQMAKRGNFVTKRCPRCKKTVTVSTKELAMDLCDSDSE